MLKLFSHYDIIIYIEMEMLKHLNVEDIFITGCTRSCWNDVQSSKWKKFHQTIFPFQCISKIWICKCNKFLKWWLPYHWMRPSGTSMSPNWVIVIGSGDCFSPVWCQPIILTNDGLMIIAPVGVNFNGIVIKRQRFSLKKMHLKMSAKWRPFCLGSICFHSLWPADAQW